MNTQPKVFFDCGGCGALHPFGWAGDCRQDAMRYDDERIEREVGRETIDWVIGCELCGTTTHSSADHWEHPDLKPDEWTEGFDV